MNTRQVDAMEETKIQIFQAAGGVVRHEVILDQDTVWLSQAQMVQLFGRDQSVVSRHICNALSEGKVTDKSNMQKMHIANFGLGKMPQFELLQKLHQFKRDQQASQASSLLSIAQGGADS